MNSTSPKISNPKILDGTLAKKKAKLEKFKRPNKYKLSNYKIYLILDFCTKIKEFL